MSANRGMRRTPSRFLRAGLGSLGSLFVVGLFLAVLSWWDAHTPLAPPLGGAIVYIGDGTSFRTVSRQLMEGRIIRSVWNFRLWARFTGMDRQIRVGDYVFHEPATPLELLARLCSDDGLHSVTVPEGSTLRDVAGYFARAGFGAEDQFLCLAGDPEFLRQLQLPASGLEGYLYPDTYRFAWEKTPAEILAAMVQRSRQELQRLNGQREASGLTEHQMVTLASIIEKETGVAEERALVSAVFRNRLRIGMRLQADPTAIYGREQRQVPTANDLEVDSPYNTYLIAGLPPGPICNPGRASLLAAVSPAAVDYIYFVARGDGTHVFSRTLGEHNDNVGALRRRQTNGR